MWGDLVVERRCGYLCLSVLVRVVVMADPRLRVVRVPSGCLRLTRGVLLHPAAARAIGNLLPSRFHGNFCCWIVLVCQHREQRTVRDSGEPAAHASARTRVPRSGSFAGFGQTYRQVSELDTTKETTFMQLSAWTCHVACPQPTRASAAAAKGRGVVPHRADCGPVGAPTSAAGHTATSGHGERCRDGIHQERELLADGAAWVVGVRPRSGVEWRRATDRLVGAEPTRRRPALRKPVRSSR